MIKRKIFNSLIEWKNKKNRKPLILKWARQVWKSFIIKEFWKNNFRKIFEVNFQSKKSFKKIFDWNIDSKTILLKLESMFEESIDIENDLLFFDEVQECPKALTSLKYFCEDLPELSIISAWSYLWLLNENESFPVWKVDFLSMFPLSFEEFLLAKNSKLYDFYNSIDIKNPKNIDEFYHEKLLEILNLYFLIWWMPEVVKIFLDWWLNLKNLKEVRLVQNSILESYERDFIKYSWVLNTSEILSVYDWISSQLQKTYDESVNRFKFSWVISWKKSFTDFSWYLTFLSKSRLIIKNFIADKPEKPLKWYIKNNIFKLFFHDIWLLNAKLWVSFNDFINWWLWSYKWYIVENFAAQEFFSKFDDDLISRKERNSEIEFLIQKDDLIIPVEIKSSKKYRQAKSLKVFIEKFSPEVSYKITMENFYQTKKFINLPLYLIWKI